MHRPPARAAGVAPDLTASRKQGGAPPACSTCPPAAAAGATGLPEKAGVLRAWGGSGSASVAAESGATMAAEAGGAGAWAAKDDVGLSCVRGRGRKLSGIVEEEEEEVG